MLLEWAKDRKKHKVRFNPRQISINEFFSRNFHTSYKRLEDTRIPKETKRSACNLSFTCQGLRGSPLLLVFHDLRRTNFPAVSKGHQKESKRLCVSAPFFWGGKVTVFSQQVDDRNPKQQSIHFKIFESRLLYRQGATAFCPTGHLSSQGIPKSPDINSSTNQPSSSHTPQTQKKMLTSISKF